MPAVLTCDIQGPLENSIEVFHVTFRQITHKTRGSFSRRNYDVQHEISRECSHQFSLKYRQDKVNEKIF